MNEMNRLVVDPRSSRLELEILASWRRESPDPAGKERMLAALGLGLAAPIATTAAAGSLAPKAISTIGWMVWGKWIAIGVAGLAVAGGVAHSWSAPPSAIIANAPVTTTVAAPAAQPAPEAPIVDTATIVAPAPVRASAPVSSASLTEQVAAIDHARAALESGDATGAIAQVDAYEARYSDGAFRQEADLLRIEALDKRGEHSKATAAGRRFLKAYPKSPHAARVRALLAP